MGEVMPEVRPENGVSIQFFSTDMIEACNQLLNEWFYNFINRDSILIINFYSIRAPRKWANF